MAQHYLPESLIQTPKNNAEIMELPLISIDGQANYNPMDPTVSLMKQPIHRYYSGQSPQTYVPGFGGQGETLKYFKEQDMEMQFMERSLRPEVEEQIKEGFFEIRKKYDEEELAGRRKRGGPHQAEEDSQVYVSHLCLHNYHPIFCKFEIETVKVILHYSSIV